MRINLKKISYFRNIIWILLVILIIIIGYNLFFHSNIYEGVTDMSIRKILIEPAPNTGNTWLHISELLLYDSNDNLITYKASSSNGSWANWWTPDKLSDNNTHFFNTFASGQPRCTLTIIPNAPVVRVKITNQIWQGYVSDRINSYQMTFKNANDYTIGVPIRLNQFPSLLDKNMGLTAIIIPSIKGPLGTSGEPGKPGKDGTNGTNGKPGKPGEPGDKGDKGDRGEKGEIGTDGKTFGSNVGISQQ
jgi:hypothetical protein